MCGFAPRNLTVGLGWAPSPPYNPWQARRLLSSSVSLPLRCRSLQCPNPSFSCHHALGSNGYALGAEAPDTLILSSSRGIQDVTGPCPEAAGPKERCGQRPSCSLPSLLRVPSRGVPPGKLSPNLPPPRALFPAPQGGFLLEQGLIPCRG